MARFLIPNPQSRIPSRRFAARRGIGLLEVLIAIFLLMVGLLGLAVLIVVGKLTLMQVERSDRTAACGHAAVHEIKVRNLLNYNLWNPATWQASHLYVAGTVISPAVYNGHFYSCIAGGTNGATPPPTWPINGGTVADGGVTWQDIGGPTFALDPLGLTDMAPLGPPVAPPFPNSFGPLPRLSWTWHASQAYVLGSIVTPTTRNGHCYRCTVAGFSGTTEPATWPTNTTTTTDNTVTWLDVGSDSVTADAIFRSCDDLIFMRPEELNPPIAAIPAGSRAVGSIINTFTLSGVAAATDFAVGDPITSGAKSATITQWAYSAASSTMTVTLTPGSASFAPSDVITDTTTSKTGTVSAPVTVQVDYVGDTSWFMTLSPAPAEVGLPVSSRTAYNVSVVVCYQRNLLMNGGVPDGEQTYPLASGGGPPAVTMLTVPAYGSGSIVLSGPTNAAPTVKNGQWLMLCSGTQATWYRVANAAPPQTVTIANSINVTVPRVDQYITILGPDWNGGASLSAVTVDGVTGVYTATLPVQQ